MPTTRWLKTRKTDNICNSLEVALPRWLRQTFDSCEVGDYPVIFHLLSRAQTGPTMMPLYAYCPEIAREETKVVELAFGTGNRAQIIAFVERFDDADPSEGRRATVQLVDLDERQELAAVGVDIDTDDGDGDVRDSVYLERTSQSGLEARLLRAVVEGYIRWTDYGDRLRDHGRRFREAVEIGREVPSSPPGPAVNGAAPPIDEYLEQLGQFDLDEVADNWRVAAETPAELNRILRLYFDSQSGYGTAFDGAKTILDGLGIEVDQDEVVEAAGTVGDARSYPESWKTLVEARWELERPVIEDILPGVAEALWDRWCDTPRPHLISKEIGAGYDMRYDESGGAEGAWQHWTQAWEHIETWLVAQEGTDEGLTAVLDEALDLAEASHNWLTDLHRLCRELARPQTSSGTGPERCLNILTSMVSLMTDSERGLKNSVEATRYATLRDMDRREAGYRVLESLVEHPTSDVEAAVFLSNMIGLWDYDIGDREFELITEFVEDTITRADPVDARMLGEVRERLQELR